MANQVTLGRAYVMIGAKVDASLGKVMRGISTSLADAGKTLIRSGTALAAMGTTITAPMLLITDQIVKNTENIAKAARRAGTSLGFMSELSHAARLAGADMGVLEKATLTMSKMLVLAGQGAKTQGEALKDIGLTIEDLQGLNVEEQFLKIGEAIGTITDQNKRIASAAALLGRSGTQLLPLFQSGAEGIAAARKEAERLGISISPEDARRAEDYVDIQERLGAALRGLGMSISRTVLPFMQKYLLFTTNLVNRTRQYLDLNPQIVEGVFKFGKALVTVGAVLVSLGGAMVAFSALFVPPGIFGVAAAGALLFSGVLDDTLAQWWKVVTAFEVGGRSIAAWGGLIAEAWAATTPVFTAIGEGISTLFDNVWLSVKATAFNAFLGIANGISQTFWKAFNEVIKATSWLVDKLAFASFKAGAITREQLGRTRVELELFQEQAEKALTGQAFKSDAFFKSFELEGGKFELTSITDAARKAKDDVAGILGEPIAIAIDTVLGKGSDTVKNFTDIFKNLGQEFGFNANIVGAGAGVGAAGLGGKAAGLAFESRGAFSAKAAGQLTRKSSLDEKVQQDQLAALQAIGANTKQLVDKKGGANYK